MIRVVAPGKMILLGEYAVLEDAPALVCAVNKFAAVTMEPLRGQEFRFSAPSLDLTNLPFVITPKGHVRFDPSLPPVKLKRLELFSKIFEYVYRKAGISARNGWFIEIDTDDFYSRELHSKFGFGSSAALCVALVTATVRAFDLRMSEQALFRLALEAHHYAQGKMGSGIDVAASFFGGYLIYRRVYEDDPIDKIPQKISGCKGLYFKPVFTGRSASTRKLVKGVSRLKEDFPDVYREIMEKLKQISVEGSEHFKEQNPQAFLNDVLLFYRTLKELGDRSGMPIISETHQRIFNLAQKENVAYKPSGAGSGDIGILFSEDPDRLERAAQQILQAGFLPLNIETDHQGKRILPE